MQNIPPELRENPNVIDKAVKAELKPLIEQSDLKGMLHVHSNWSDGRDGIREIAIECKKLGYEYLAICDHSVSSGYANGLSDERVLEQFKEIDKLNEEGLGIHILKGLEADIKKDGSLDNSESILSQLDIVVASVHSNFNLSKKEMTKRLVYALMSPYTTILGHPTGRLLLVRKGYEVDIDEIIKVAADYGKIIEINSNPYRLDLSWENCIKAKEKGVKLAINPDSHRIETLGDVRYGVRAARKASIEKDDVINCLSYNDFMKEIVER
ncbi:MAG: PHP domain-containing protein [Ignavibacteria bacterium]|nr:PHP domain-containing protein [Ignavibacteria bacterium]